MAIDTQNSDAIARHRKKDRRAARTEGADAAFASFHPAFYRRSSGRFTHSDLDDRKSSIMTAVSACNFNVDIWSIPGAISNGLGRRASGESLLRRADSQGTVWAMGVIPGCERIETALNNPPFTGGAGYGKIRPVLRNSVVCLAVAGCLEA